MTKWLKMIDGGYIERTVGMRNTYVSSIEEDAIRLGYDMTLYKNWARMFSAYSGKGNVSEQWQIFWTFYSDMYPRPKGTFLVRVDKKLPFSKENCKWDFPPTRKIRARVNNISYRR